MFEIYDQTGEACITCIMFELYDQTGEVPTKRKNKAYAVIKNEMEERERAKKRQSKNMVSFDLLTTHLMIHMNGWMVVKLFGEAGMPPKPNCQVRYRNQSKSMVSFDLLMTRMTYGWMVII